MIGRAVRQSPGQDRRRLLILTAYASLAIYVVTSVLTGDTAWFWPIQFGWITATVIHIRFLRPATQEIADETVTLDERQTMVRNRAYYWAYRIITFAILLPAFYVVVARQTGVWLPDLTVTGISAIFVGLVWVVIMLPTSIIAWNEPDPEPDE